MVKINGTTPNLDICNICGAKMRKHDGTATCPNADRKDHRGEEYHGRA